MKWIRYTEEQREWAVQQMMPPLNRAVVELAKATGISTVTLRQWQKAARAAGKVLPGHGLSSDQWSSTDKFRIVLETAALSEAELSAYCRRTGIYPEQIAQWRLACELANLADQTPQPVPDNAQRVSELERALKRSQAALAETSALLDLRKKAEAIWGKGEEE